MKLKKIASLALAGIMAVSMLAGCNGANDPTEPENPVVPAGSSIASYVNALLSKDEAKNIEFTDEASLRTALNTVAAKQSIVSKADIDGAKNATTLTYATEPHSDVAIALTEEFSNGIFTTNSFDSWKTKGTTDKSGTDYYMAAYVLNGDMSEGAVANAVYDGWTATLKTLDSNSVTNKNCDWSGAVSAVKVYNNTDPDTSAWVVAVMITKTVSDIANTVQ